MNFVAMRNSWEIRKTLEKWDIYDYELITVRRASQLSYMGHYFPKSLVFATQNLVSGAFSSNTFGSINVGSIHSRRFFSHLDRLNCFFQHLSCELSQKLRISWH